MADSSPLLLLDDVLEKLSFKHFYPEKLTREDLYQITPESLNTGQKKCSLAWQFVYDLTRYNYHARNIKISGTEHVEPFKMSFRERTRLKREATCTNIHPLDVLVAVFLCCDPTAKQDFITHLWGCKLAMPFSLQLSEMMKPTVFLWPLRSLIGQFQKYDSYTEMQMIHEPMKCIAFIRAEENEQFSKSSLLNCLIGGSEKPHPMFFHRNSEGSKRSRSNATNGLVELGWFLPSENNAGRFKEPKLFVNLRGNALALNEQIDLIGTMATVTVFLCTVQNLEDMKMTVKRLLRLESRVILLISDQNPDYDVIDNYIKTSFENEPESRFDVVTSERSMLSEMLDMLLHNINRMENGGKEVVLSDIVKNLSNMKFSVDEANIDFATAFEYSNDMVEAIRCSDEKDRKLTILPLQEKFWKTWAQMDRDFWRFDQLDESEKKKYESKDRLEKKMLNVRNQQFQHFANQGISKPMMIFVKALSNFKDFTRKIFLRMLKLELDSLSRIHLKPFYDRYQELINQTISATEEERIKINNELSDLDDMKSKLSFGMEHVIRELGQLYEACESQPDQNIVIKIEEQKISYKELPRYACLSLLEGYPIEILDGEACSVPILWITSIFKELPDVLRVNNTILKPADDIRVHTISVLGIQSSGKSTFLNVLFGLQFAVSAGRCTRGAFMQLVKVQPSTENDIQADFILAIDTEGLKAAELISTESVKHDNELSTFVIGLADTTVINLMGENATYLHENLPIAVHAFLRMNLVGLHPRCTIVHHNVDKRNREKLIQQSRILENVLNNLTKKACELEKIPPRLFHEIIEFSILHNTDYVPSLYEGEQPMAPVSIGYSKEVDSVRTKLMDYVRCDSKIDNVTNFVRHLQNLWNAIKKDRFVFEFRTTLEAEARLDLDKGYFRILLEYCKQIDEISTRLTGRLKSKQYSQKNVEDRFSKDEAIVRKKVKVDLKRFLEKPKKITSPYFDHWKQKCLENLHIETEKVRASTYEMFQYVSTPSIPSIPAERIESFIAMMSLQQGVFKDFDSRFSEVWLQWIKTLNLPRPGKSILTDITEALQAVCPAHKHLLSEKEVKASSLTKIKPHEQAHLNHAFHKFSSARVAELLSNMKAIQSRIIYGYKRELSAFLIKFMPYSNVVPKQILLKIEGSLRKELDNFDTNNEISHMFCIDLLLCTSGTMVNDLKCHMEKHSVLRSVKKELKVLVKKQEGKKATDILFEMLFSSIDRIDKIEFFGISQQCLISALSTSNYNVISSKQGLLGCCLYHAINTDNDELLSLYFHSPESATAEYLSSILIKLAKGARFKTIIKEYLRATKLNMFEYIFGSFKEDNISFHEVFHRFIQHVYIDSSIINLYKEKVKIYMESTVNIERLRADMRGKCEQYLDAKTEDLVSEISTDSMYVISMIANKFSGKLIGCNALCPFCNEICKFSFCHPGQHECFIHRPVGCRGMHWKGTYELSYETCTLHCRKGNLFNFKGRSVSFRDLNSVHPDWKVDMILNEEPSCVWKWIFVNKHPILRSSGFFELPKSMPIQWQLINRKSVLRNIRLQFEI